MSEYDQLPTVARAAPAPTAAPLPKPKQTTSADGKLGPDQIKRAIAFNNTRWKAAHRAEVLTYLRGKPGGVGFEASDVVKIAELQYHEGIDLKQVDGQLGPSTMAFLLREGLHLSELKVKPEQVRLVFYPGEFEDLAAWKNARAAARRDNGGEPLGEAEFDAVRQRRPDGHGTLYVEIDGNVVERIQARGGPPFSMKDGKHTGDPSKAGTYKLGAGKSVVTSAWGTSEIAWGAPMRSKDGYVQFKNPGQDWKFANGPRKQIAGDIADEDFHEDGDVSNPLMKEWRNNDFGETAFQVEGSPGLFIHTTPNDEKAHRKEQETHKVHEPLQLSHSHGCLHVEPIDRNRWMKTGYLQKGVTLVIKRYDEWLDPKAWNQK